MKSGFIALVGRPNVGKSTLLNSILDTKVTIISDKPGTTRNNIHGVYNEEDTQIVFVDTPGIHRPRHKLGEFLNKEAYYSISDVDAVVFLVDASEPLGGGDLFIIEHLKKITKPVILLLNKIDKIKREDILLKMTEYKDLYPFKEIIPVSALKKDNLKDLTDTLKLYLTDEIKYYPDDQITNRSLDFMIAETVREKVFKLTNEEVPHAITCIVETHKKEKDKRIITVLVIVDRESLKKIIIGKQGQMIKEIGTLARKDLEKMLDTKVYLELFVKVIKNWREREKYLKELGYSNLE